jgi:hypothetical protein
MIREELLQHFVTLTAGAPTTDAYGNPTLTFDPDEGAVETTIRAWVQQTANTETHTTAGDRLEATWLAVTNQTIDGYDRLTWNSQVFEVDGPTAPIHDRAGVHHYETTLKRVEG